MRFVVAISSSIANPAGLMSRAVSCLRHVHVVLRDLSPTSVAAPADSPAYHHSFPLARRRVRLRRHHPFPPVLLGEPVGREDCAAAVRTQPGFVAEIDGSVAGFITLLAHFEGSSEITWLAVHAGHRRSGVGHRLIEAATNDRAAAADRMMCVLTLGPSAPEEPGDNYAGTRAFYRRMGFVPLREVGLRDWNDSHALILARALP